MEEADMTDHEIREVILRGVLRDRREYSCAYYKTCHRNRSGLLLLRRHKNALEGIVAYEPSSWLERPLEAIERKHFSRVLAKMEAEGLLIRHKDERERTRNVELTVEGDQLAQSMS